MNWRDKYSEEDNRIEQLKDEFWDWFNTESSKAGRYPPSIFEWFVLKLKKEKEINEKEIKRG